MLSFVAELDGLPQLSLGTAALLIFGAIASLAMLRGLFRVLWGSIVLCLAAFAAFTAWQHSHALGVELPWRDAAWFPFAFPLLAFLAAFLILRTLGRFIVQPWRQPNEGIAEKNRRSPLRWAFTLVLSLIPASLLTFAGATLLRHAGSVAEIRGLTEKLTDQPVSQSTAFLTRLKQSIEQTIPSAWFSRIDPLTKDVRVTLAKLISLGEDAPPKAIPVLEVPAIREIVLGDPELRSLAREGRHAEILRDPRLDRILENPDLREVLQGLEL